MELNIDKMMIFTLSKEKASRLFNDRLPTTLSKQVIILLNTVEHEIYKY